MDRPPLEYVDLIITGYVLGYYEGAKQPVDKRILKQSCIETLSQFMGITYTAAYHVLGIDTLDYIDQEINRLEPRIASVR